MKAKNCTPFPKQLQFQPKNKNTGGSKLVIGKIITFELKTEGTVLIGIRIQNQNISAEQCNYDANQS